MFYTSKPHNAASLANWQLNYHQNGQISVVEDLEVLDVQIALLLEASALQAFSYFHIEPASINYH